jgi:hypothetical protein
MVIFETTVRPMDGAVEHPKEGLEQHPCLTASSPSMALVYKLRNPRFLFTMSMSE